MWFSIRYQTYPIVSTNVFGSTLKTAYSKRSYLHFEFHGIVPDADFLIKTVVGNGDGGVCWCDRSCHAAVDRRVDIPTIPIRAAPRPRPMPSPSPSRVPSETLSGSPSEDGVWVGVEIDGEDVGVDIELPGGGGLEIDIGAGVEVSEIRDDGS